MADLDRTEMILNDEAVLVTGALEPGNLAIADKVTGQPVLLARGPTGTTKRKSKKKKKKTFRECVDTVEKELRPMYRSVIADQYGLNNMPGDVGRKISIKIVTLEQVKKLGLALHQDLLKDEWDMWQVLFMRNPDFVIKKLMATAVDEQEKQEIDAITNLDRKWKRRLMPFGASYYHNLWKADLTSGKSTGSTVAFYWPRKDRIYLIREAFNPSTYSDVANTLAHELTHAYASRSPNSDKLKNDWRRLLLLLNLQGNISTKETSDFNEAITQWIGYKVYVEWYTKYASSGKRGAKASNRYGSKAHLELIWEAFTKPQSAGGITENGVMEGFFNGAIWWQLDKPQENLEFGQKKIKWSWSNRGW